MNTSRTCSHHEDSPPCVALKLWNAKFQFWGCHFSDSLSVVSINDMELLWSFGGKFRMFDMLCQTKQECSAEAGVFLMGGNEMDVSATTSLLSQIPLLAECELFQELKTGSGTKP